LEVDDAFANLQTAGDDFHKEGATMVRHLLIGAMAWAMAAAATAEEHYVAPDGDDRGPGSFERPFRTIQQAVDRLGPGDVCYVRGGVYRESVTLKNSGLKGKPIRLVAYPGETAILSGTEPLAPRWRRHQGAIYKTRVDREFVQLFVDDKMMIEARWPNARFAELLDRSKWAQAVKGSRYGMLKDPELAKTGIDFTGALATLNVTHQFYTWTRPVTKHGTGSDSFEFPKDFGKATEMRFGEKPGAWSDDRYYLSGVLAALDAPTEWFLDAESKTLYLWAEDSGDPTGKRIEVKARDFAIEGEGLSYVEIEGLHFFGATFQLRNSSHCVVDNCHLLYPTYARELTELELKPVNTPRTAIYGDHNAVRNCSLAYSPTIGLLLVGRQNSVENNLIHDLCWVGSLRYVAVQMSPGQGGKAEPGGLVRGNTVFNCGNAIINYRGQPHIIERNHVYNGGLACKDVALVYTGQPSCAGSVVRYNWVHGCRTEEGAGLGMRGDDQTRSLTMHHNVVWDCGRDGIIIKGDHNKAYNNTVLYIGTEQRLGNFLCLPTRPEPAKAWRTQHPLLQEQNTHTEIFNNVARTITEHMRQPTPFPPSENLANNYTGEELGLEDPHNWDFRPKQGSPLIDAGREIPGFTDGFAGKAPDAGAYEYGGENWKPGHRNGLWIAGAGDGLALRVALLMPPLELAEIEVQPGAQSLRFTPDDWMTPREIALPAGTAQARFRSDSWGDVDVDLAKSASGSKGVKVWFAEPDLGEPKPLDTRFKTLRFPQPPEPRGTTKPVARAFKVDTPVQIDGLITPDEWPGWRPERRVLLRPLRPLRPRDTRAEEPSELYALFDEANLYLAIRVCRQGAASMPRGEGEWGASDAVEVALQPLGLEEPVPVYVLRGFPSGKLECATVGGATPAQAKALGSAAEFGARVGDNEWSAEFRLPLASLGDGGAMLARARFNAGVRLGEGETGEWLAWVRTGKGNYAVEHAGELVLRPSCRADAENLLQGGDFESANLGRWEARNNKGKIAKSQIVRRVREGADGGWCVQIECADADLMKEGVLKWMHPLGKTVGPGRYTLSYDLRVENLSPRGKPAMFCGYVRGQTGPKEGRNLGQMEHAFDGAELPWTRRDCLIEIPEGLQPSFVSLQLHRATGTAWVDNVSLLRCE
jgi:hypothetical protein